MGKIIISPSILSADFADIGSAIREIDASGAKWVHLDIMDGSFVQNLTFGPPVIRSIRSRTKAFFDVHLMIVNPERHIKEFALCGADSITFHYEASGDRVKLLQEIKKLNIDCGISIKPSTPVSVLEETLPFIDLALIMTVEPGYGGQELIPECLEKVRALSKMREKAGLGFHISVDGGINEATAKTAVEAGADVLVIGSAFFKSGDKRELVGKIRGQGADQGTGSGE